MSESFAVQSKPSIYPQDGLVHVAIYEDYYIDMTPENAIKFATLIIKAAGEA